MLLLTAAHLIISFDFTTFHLLDFNISLFYPGATKKRRNLITTAAQGAGIREADEFSIDNATSKRPKGI